METLGAEQLRRLTLSDFTPFRLSTEGGELQFEQCLRLLPGKRIAGAARYDGQRVFAKVFFHDRHGAAADAELKNLRQLFDAGVLVPEPRALLQGGDFSALLVEWLPEARGLESLLREHDEAAIDDLLEQLRALYRTGLYQADLHLDNFLRADGRVWLVDAGEVRALPAGGWRRSRRIIANLALLCAQAPLADSGFLQRRVTEAFGFTGARERRFRRLVRKARNRRIRHANRKWLRACSAIRVLEHGGEYWLLDRDAGADIEALLARPRDAALIKQGSRISVYGNERWILKHYRDTSVKARLKRALGLDSARRSWVMGRTLNLLGVPTPLPLGWRRAADGSSVLLFPRLTGERMSEQMEQDPGAWERLAPRVREWLRRLRQAGFWHGDMKAQNILVPGDEPWFIDLDAAGWSACRWLAGYHNRRDRARFERNPEQFRSVGEEREDSGHERKE